MSKYIELTVEVNSLWSEYLSELMINRLGCAGVVFQEIKYKDEEVVKSTEGFIKGYIWLNSEKPAEINYFQKILYESKRELEQMGINNAGSFRLSTKEVADEEWAHSWKKFWHPQKIGQKIVICPSWEEYIENPTDIKLILDPGTAFGTGTHPTTRLCIMAIEKYLKQGNEIADVGAGSGILSVVSAKLGAGRVVGVDNDPSVISIAAENALINNVENTCSFYEGSAGDIKEKYDIVAANILAEVIVEILAELLGILKDGGRLILSGIISEKAFLVEQALAQRDAKIIEFLEEDNWVAIIAIK